MDLLGNAIESIRLGVEDFQVGSHARLMAAVRNIHAGILLLYKEALRRRCPEQSDEVLVKAKIVPSLNDSGELIFIGKGTKTADVSQIRERFEGLNISTDWKGFEVVSKARNDVEHYYPHLNQQALHGVVAASFAIVRDFVARELGAEPRELLGDATWQAMLTVAEVYAEERKVCDAAVASATWPSDSVQEGLSDLVCPECGSDLLAPTEESVSFSCPRLSCRSCGGSVEPEVFVPAAVAAGMAYEMYLHHTDGDEPPYTECPECLEDTYLVDERRCALCGHEAEHTCSVCGNEIVPEELGSSPLCGWCAHQMSKDD